MMKKKMVQFQKKMEGLQINNWIRYKNNQMKKLNQNKVDLWLVYKAMGPMMRILKNRKIKIKRSQKIHKKIQAKNRK